MDEIYNPRLVAAQASLNAMPVDTPMVPPGGPSAGTTFKNVKVVGDLGVGEFTRLMVSMTAWVAPQQGCSYCHKPGEDFSTDALYTKVVARRMLEMTRHINSDWKTHVAETGVTCYTCHRGLNVPANVWFAPPTDPHANAMLGSRAGQNAPAPLVGMSSLPNDPFSPYLEQGNEIRVIGTKALADSNRRSEKQAEFTYGLMMHMSQALGVNCTFCHNTRSFAEWDTSTPQRATAWYGIRMTRDLNVNFLDSLAGVFPPNRLGPTGDVPKADCATCHQGAFKPMYGASLLKTHPELAGVHAAIVGGGDAPVVSPTGAELYFPVGSATLTPQAQAGLETLIAALKANPAAKLEISGFHSASGDLAQNQELAKQRAFAVRDAVKAAGIAEDRLVLAKPQSAEANLAGEDPKARRVDVAIK
jgi:photosynthetic reaction center cytochrome c subunit